MKIIFSLVDTGLGNNGGSKTFIRSAETLQELGHDVSLCSPKNSCSWWKIKVPVTKKLQPCDVLIASGYGSVASTIRFKSARLKLWYVRAHENWVTNDANLMNGYRKLKCIANSRWIVDWLSKFKIDCELVYPGLDFECYHKSSKARENILGGLMHKHARKRSKDCIAVHKKSGFPMKMLNRDFKGGKFKKLSNFYNEIKVWISPSENEGLQNVPIEAALCGCGLVLTDHFMGGTVDYAIDEETCLIYPARDIKHASECVTRLMKDNDLCKKLNNNAIEAIRTNIGVRTHNMEKFVKFLKKNLK